MKTSQNATVVFANPTWPRLTWEITNALEAVQGDARIRRVKMPEQICLAEVMGKPEGMLQFNGGQPHKSDHSYTAGQTSRLGLAWWTDRNKVKHVRVEADRTQASNFAIPDIFSLVRHPFHIVFPQHDPCYCCRCSHVVPAGEGHWDGEEEFACDSCVEQDKYLQETGFLPPGNRKRKGK